MSGFVILKDHGPFPAERCGVKGTVTFKTNGPQWGAFHPGGDESIVVPIVKWDPDVSWQSTCSQCGCAITTSWGHDEVIGPYCDGCFGYPACSCKKSHTGNCPIQ